MMAERPQHTFIVKGGSMHPLLSAGDQIDSVPIARPGVHPGDVLIFTADSGKQIIHRVVQLNPLVTRGDNCDANDPAVPDSSPLFMAVHRIRNGRKRMLTCGKCGLRQHHWHQCRRRIMKKLSAAAALFLSLNPFRISNSGLIPVSFPGKRVYYLGKWAVGWYDDSGRWHWMRFARWFIQKPSWIPAKKSEPQK